MLLLPVTLFVAYQTSGDGPEGNPAGALLVNGHALEVDGHPLTLGRTLSSYGSFAIVDEVGNFAIDEEAVVLDIVAPD